MTALARQHFEDLGFTPAIDEVASRLGDKVYSHYFLNIVDAAHNTEDPKVILDFSEIGSFKYKLKTFKGTRTTTFDAPRHVEFETMLATIDFLDRDFFFNNIISAIEEAIERFEGEDNYCITICYEDSGMYLKELIDGLKYFICKHIEEGWRYDGGIEAKTFSIFKD